MSPSYASVMLPFAFFDLWTTTLAVGVGAASIPIIIHLLNRRRYQIVTWAAMRFLLAAQKETTRKMRLEQLILLILRTVLVILIVLAMASVMPWAENVWAYVWPEGSGILSKHGGRTHKILVLDGSLSMAAKVDGDKSAFQQALTHAIEIVENSPAGDGFSVLLMKDSPSWVIAEIASDRAKVVAELKAIRQSHGNADVDSTLNMLAAKLADSPDRFQRREIYFLTDMQRATWLSSDVNQAEKALQGKQIPLLDQLQEGAQTYFVDVSGSDLKNVAVTDLTIESALITTGAETTIAATLTNYSKALKQNLRVELLVGKAREDAGDSPFALRPVKQELVDLKDGNAVTLTFPYTFNKAGTYAVQVRVEDDDLQPDDMRTVVVQVRDNVPVLLVNGKPAVDPFDSATGYLRLMLNPFEKEPIPAWAPLRPKVITTPQFADSSESNLANYDCIFLCDVGQLGTGELRRLETHLHRGGGIVISMGDVSGAALEIYNRLLFQEGKGILPAKLMSIQHAPKHHHFVPHAEEEAYRLPPLKAFAADDQRTQLSSVRFQKYVRAQLAHDANARAFLSFMPEVDLQAKVKPDDTLPLNDPLLVEWNPPLPAKPNQEPGKKNNTAPGRFRGKVVLMTSTWNMDWNSWPGSPSCAAMVQEITRLAVSGRLHQQESVVGSPIEEYLLSNGAELLVHVRTPLDFDAEPKQVRTEGPGEVSLFRWDQTETSGIYRATVGHDHREYLFAVNVPTSIPNQKDSESDLTRISDSKFQQAYPGWDIQIVRQLNEIRRGGNSSGNIEDGLRGPVGPIIANVLLLLVLILLITEAILACVLGHYSAVPHAASQTKRERRLFPIMIGTMAGVLFLAIFTSLVHAAWTGDFMGFLPDSVRARVETAMNIPPPAPGEGTRWALEFNPFLLDGSTDFWFGVAVALGAIVMLVTVQRFEGFRIPIGYKVLLAGLRFFLILLTLSVLLPQIQLSFERRGWPDVVILVDDSLSMGEQDQYQDESVRATVLQLSELAREQMKESLPKQISDLERLLSEKQQQTGPAAPESVKQEISELQSHISKLQGQLDDLNSASWRPTRLQLVQALIGRSNNSWIEALLNQRRMKVHLFHLDHQGRATKVVDAQGKPADVNEQDARLVAAANHELGRLQPHAVESRLGSAVRQVLDYYRGASLSAIIMLTDGVTTREESLTDVAQYAAQKGVPLFFVGVGDDHELRDLKLHDLQVEDTVYVNDRLIFEARLTGQGYKNLTVPVVLKIREKDGTETELARELVKVDPQGKPVRIRLKHQPTQPGEKLFIIEVIPPKAETGEKETTYSNLRLQRTVFVQETKLIKVLYVEGSARYDYRFIKSLFEREKQEKGNRTIDLKVVLLDSDPDAPIQDRTLLAEFPFNRVELFQYDVVILGDFDPRSPKIGEQKMRDLADFVRERGGGLLFIAGPLFSPHAFKGTTLAEVLPVEVLQDFADVPDNIKVGYRPELTPAGRLHPIFRFSPNDGENIEIWRQLEPMFWFAHGFRIKPAAEVLAVHPTEKREATSARDQDPRLPLVVQQFVGAGRSMFFGFDETWRWRMRDDEVRFNQFWIQTVRYLSRNRQSRTNLRLDRQTPYRQGEPIKVTVRFPDNLPLPGQAERLKAGIGPDVRVMIEYQPQSAKGQMVEPETQTLQLSRVEGSWATYEGILSRTREGKYRFRLVMPDVSKLQPDNQNPSAEAVVVLPPGELDRLRMERAEMTSAAASTDGQFYTLAEADSLVHDIPSGYRVALNTPGPPHLLWNHTVCFLLILSLLTSEWVLRKRKHLL